MNRDTLHERLRAIRADFIAEMLPDNADGQAQRVCGRFALIAAGGELATSLKLTGWEPGAATQAASKCFEAWLDNRGGAGAQEEKTALAQVQAFFDFVLPEAWRAEVCAGLDSRYVARLCVERGLIQPGKDGRPTCIHRLADMGPTRCYHFTNIGGADNAD
jgi:putative DNA primase/helicase